MALIHSNSLHPLNINAPFNALFIHKQAQGFPLKGTSFIRRSSLSVLPFCEVPLWL